MFWLMEISSFCVGVMYSGEYDASDVTQSNITSIISSIFIIAI